LNRGRLGLAVGLITVAGAELAYFALAIYLVKITRDSQHLHKPHVGGGVIGATGALAGAFGAGYAALLGVPADVKQEALRARQSSIKALWGWLKSALSLNNVLATGVIMYMLASAAIAVTYVIWEVESPGIVKTIAVGFGGYVIAYVGKAFADWGAANPRG
jgi:hypothetical protein